MPQKTNLNVNPYFDDFDKDDNFYKVLFKPGYPVQARELTNLQSILQNQIESFGKHTFKEGSLVIPGEQTCDDTFTTIKVNRDHLGIDVSVYLDAIVSANGGKGSELLSKNTNISARISGYLLPPQEGVEEITLFVKFITGDGEEGTSFEDGEELLLQDNIAYGNTSILSGDSVFTLSSINAVNTGYAFGITDGIYYIRGTFVHVKQQRIVLDPYNNTPSYRVGFDIIENILNSDQEPKLNDNAKGFTNYAAPGADRLKIELKLTKKQLTDNEDTSFVELVRIEEGVIKKIQNTSQYSEIKKYFAKRTFEESGNYAVDNFIVDVVDLLNDETGNGGLFTEEELTDDGNVPKEENMGIRVSAGTAYVRGFDIDHIGSTIVDVPKPRKTKPPTKARIPFDMGSLIRVNNVHGTPFINIGGSTANVIGLYNKRRDGVDNGGLLDGTGQGDEIGKARVYWFGLTDAKYTGAETSFDLYLYDIQTYTEVKVTNFETSDKAPDGSRIRGLSSGAVGYVSARSGRDLSLAQTSGNFLKGEDVIINEVDETITSITKVTVYDISDIKSVYQDFSSLSGNTNAPDFVADTVLYEQPLANVGATDLLDIVADGSGHYGQVSGRYFAGINGGLKKGSILKYQSTGNADPTYNTVVRVRPGGKKIELVDAPFTVSNVCDKAIVTGQHIFSLMAPKILAYGDNGLYAPMPVENIASVDLSSANLTITKQISGQNVSGNQKTISISEVLDTSAGIVTAFFESFDQERYGITDASGSPVAIDSGMVTLGANAESITFTNLVNANNYTFNVTLKKEGVTNKSKEFVRSSTLDIVRTTGISTVTGLSTSPYYGTRVEDEEISLNVPDVVNLRAVYESSTNDAPVLDKLTFSTGLALNQSVIVGEKIFGNESRSVGQVVSRTSTTVDYIALNDDTFTVGESVIFKDSSVEAVVQQVNPGTYLDVTSNYSLNKSHGHQFCNYSKIERREGSPTPDRKLKIIFDYYKVGAGNAGDIFTVNSYTADRFGDIPLLSNGLRASDMIDFRPRVKPWTDISGYETKSPFAFESREFEYTYKYVISPGESSSVGYTYYLPRVDLVTLNKSGQIEVTQGVSADEPESPTLSDDSMELAQVFLPPYLYNTTKDPRVVLRDNRRFTMRDIGALENRIENLEDVTSLTMLELTANTTKVTDANGLNRFKSGFVVSDFKDKSIMNKKLSTVDVNTGKGVLVAPVDMWTIDAELRYHPNIDVDTADLSQDLELPPASGCQKTGDLITIKYKEKEWITQPHATKVENVNPFNVITFTGGVILDPSSDNWVRTIYLPDNQRTESTGAKWKQQAKTTTSISDPIKDHEIYKKGGGRGEKVKRVFTTQQITTKTKFKPKLTGPSREFDYVEDVKVSGEADPWMRSRNVSFFADGLRPNQRHYLYLDSQQVNYVPRIFEIEMNSGTFDHKENVIVHNKSGNKKVGYFPLAKPNRKIGNQASPEISAGLGKPSLGAEKYTVNPYDKNAPAPGDGYSPTSTLLNVNIKRLAKNQKFFGFVKKGFHIEGEKSGACATVKDVKLLSDNWGDILGSFYIRDPNGDPLPSIRVKSGTKTVKITSVKPGEVEVPGSTTSFALGSYSGDGTILTQETSRVSVRNPVKPQPLDTIKVITPVETTIRVIDDFEREDDTEKKVKAVHRDPLAQSFTVDENGAFLTSFDLYFASVDPKKKVYIELRTMELGTPTNLLVEDYTKTYLKPEDINVSDDPLKPKATNVRFSSPVYLEPDTEYAIVILSPSSDRYEMWTAEMGQKTVNSSKLIRQGEVDVNDVVVTKQYIGGSLFKSQNGTIWTPSQMQDLTFTLYKAKFKETGSVIFYNSDITPKGDNAQKPDNNPIEAYPRKLKVPISGTFSPNGAKLGTKIIQGSGTTGITGYVDRLGAAIQSNDSTAVSIAKSGTDYTPGTYTGVNLFSLGGRGEGAPCNGEGAVATIEVNSAGNISLVTVTTGGSGYISGEHVGITTSDLGGSSAGGFGAKLTVKDRVGTVDTLYLTDVQGEHFINTEDIYYYTDPINSPNTTANSGATVNGTSSIRVSNCTGNVFRIKQRNHANHGGNSRVTIEDIEPDTKTTVTTAKFDINDTLVSVEDISAFATYENSTSNSGYALINTEVVAYSAVTAGSGNAGTLTISDRGLNGTTKTIHSINSTIRSYQVNGISLMRINTTHSIPSTYHSMDNSNLDYYYLEFDRSTQFPTARDSGDAMLNFASRKGFGGKDVGVSQNYQYSTIKPKFNVITPGKGTSVECNIRTISGTSAGGNEVPFLDQGYEPVTLNKNTKFDTPRMLASRVNELEQLDGIPRNRSLSLRVDMVSGNENMSPVLDLQNAGFVIGRNKINSPVSDYVNDSRSNKKKNDPHGAVFVTKAISLANPATSLKVYIAAHRQESADFRVFYSLFKADSSGIDPEFTPFPGYDNLIDDDGDGFGDRVIDPDKNSGRADAFVTANDKNGFSEYQFSVNDLEQFTAFAIKVVMSSTNECTPVKLKDFRAIALA